MVHMPPTPPGSLPPPVPSPKNGYSAIPPAPSAGPASLGNSKSWLTYEELAMATAGFAKSNILGEGGFGCVYKGVLPGGQLVAVKQLKVGGQQGDKEFRAEVEIISRVHHRHLVSLVGYCIADSQRLLVYDYVPNGTLDYHLHGKMESVMDWPTRVKIATGAARGLAYLHEDCHPRIIHRDIKSSNILLDNNFEAQVSDFGLAKLTSDTNTHVTTRVMGTFGYLAPEYASSGKLTEKSDVFSFGVVLLELVTGRKPVDPMQPIGEESLVEWARPMLVQINSEEDLDLFVDPSLNGAYDKKEMVRMIEAAAACIRHSVNKRPRMGQVVRALEGDAYLADLNKGIRPGHSGVYNSSFTSSDYDNSNYSADIRRFRQVALESQEYGSEYSGATSDYGVNPSASSSDYQTSTEVDRNTGKPQPSKPIGVRKNLSTSSGNDFPTSRERQAYLG